MINEDIPEVDNGAEFDPPAKFKPSEGPEDFDEEDSSDVMEEIDAAAFDFDPDAEQGEDFAEEDQQEDGEQPEVADPSEDASEQVEAAEAESPEEVEDEAQEANAEVVQPLSPRANDRIRQLVAEKNELAAQLAEVVALQKQELEWRRQQQQEAQRQQREAAEKAKNQAFLETLRGYQFNDGDVGHQLALQSFEAANEAKAALQRIQEERAQLQQQQRVQAYRSALASELDKTLTVNGKLIVDPTVRQAFYENAYALASIKQLSPADAIKAAVAPALGEIQKAKAAARPATKRPQPSNQVHKVISTQGRAAGRSPGTRPSEKSATAQILKGIFK